MRVSIARVDLLNLLGWLVRVFAIGTCLYGCGNTGQSVSPIAGSTSAGRASGTTSNAAGSGIIIGEGGRASGTSTNPFAGSGGVGAGGTIVAGTAKTAGAGGAGGKGSSAGTGAQTSANCASLPKLPIAAYTELALPGSEDFTFDKLGFMIGVDSANNMLFRVKYDGTREDIIPNIGTAGGPFPVRGLRFTAGANSSAGELIFADVGGNGLTKITMGDMARTSLISGVNQPNGLALDPKGFAYLTGADGNVTRVNIKTGQSSVFFKQVTENVSLDGIGFSPDFKRLYIDTEYGYLSYLPVKDDGTAGDYVIMANLTEQMQAGGPGGPPMLDGLTVDECGNVYVAQMSGTVWRVSPDSVESKPKIEEVITITSSTTTPTTPPPGGPPGGGVTFNALNFGTGVGGWKSDALYVVNMAGGVYEVVVGVQGARQPHLQ